MSQAETIIFITFIWMAFRNGYYKTLNLASGREETDGEGGDDKSKSEKKKGEGEAEQVDQEMVVVNPTDTPNPTFAEPSKKKDDKEDGATAAAAAAAAGTGKTNSLRVICSRFSWWKLCWGGSWAGLNPHRKLDLVFGLVICVVYIILSAVMLSVSN